MGVQCIEQFEKMAAGESATESLLEPYVSDSILVYLRMLTSGHLRVRKSPPVARGAHPQGAR